MGMGHSQYGCRSQTGPALGGQLFPRVHGESARSFRCWRPNVAAGPDRVQRPDGAVGDRANQQCTAFVWGGCCQRAVENREALMIHPQQ